MTFPLYLPQGSEALFRDRSQPPPAGADASTYAAAILYYLADACRVATNLQQARQMLLSRQTGRCLMQLTRLLPAEGGGLRGRQVTAYELLVYSHVATVLGQRAFAAALLRDARQEAEAGEEPFWLEYVRGMECLAQGRPYHRRIVAECRSLEHYWHVYLDLVEAITHRFGLQSTLARVDHSFKARNSDPHISQDWFRIEGSARAKVSWDFRKDAILLLDQQRHTSPAQRFDFVD